MSRPIRRVLVVQPYGIGDLLFLTPVLRALSTLPGIEKVDLLLGSRSDIVVRGNPHVDEIFCVDKDLLKTQKGRQSMRFWMDLGKQLRSRRYDLLLDYSFRDEYAAAAFFYLGIPVRAGYSRKRRGFFHNVKLPVPFGFHEKHAVDYACELAEKAIGFQIRERHLEFYLSDFVRQQAGSFFLQQGISFKRYIVASPGGGESWGKDADMKRWPVSFFADFLNRLTTDYDFDGVLLIGSASEKALCEDLVSRLRGPVANLTGKMTFDQSAAILEKAALFVGNDGGLMHLAHALRIPVIAFYGPVNPAVYGPYPISDQAITVVKEGLECRPCYFNFRYKSDCAGRECLQTLSPDEVFETLQAKNFFSKIPNLI